MAQTPKDLMNRAKNADDLGALAKQGVGGTFLAIATVLISGITTAGDLFIKPMEALAESLADLTVAIFGEPARIIVAGVDETARSLQAEFAAGPLTFALAVASILAGLYVVSAFLGEEETGNLVPGLPDVPIIGREEEDE